MCAGGLGIAASTVNSPSPLPGCDTRSTISSPVSTAGATRSRTWPSAVSIATSSEGLNGLDLWQETENGKISEPRMQYGWNTDKKAGQLPQLITIVIYSIYIYKFDLLRARLPLLWIPIRVPSVAQGTLASLLSGTSVRSVAKEQDRTGPIENSEGIVPKQRVPGGWRLDTFGALRLALSQAFPPPEAALLMPHAQRPALHLPHGTPHDRRGGARRRCPALLWVQHSPLGRNQHATRCYVFRLFPKFAAPCFCRKLMCSIKLRLFLSALGWTATLDITLFSNSSCAVMGHVAYSPKNRLFEPVSGRFTPIRPTNPRRQRNGLPTLATVLSPPAPRPTSGVRLCVDPPPLATACHRQPSSPSTPLPAAEAEERWFGAGADGDGITSPFPAS